MEESKELQVKLFLVKEIIKTKKIPKGLPSGIQNVMVNYYLTKSLSKSRVNSAIG